jgi:hypothetical protein
MILLFTIWQFNDSFQAGKNRGIIQYFYRVDYFHIAMNNNITQAFIDASETTNMEH